MQLPRALSTATLAEANVGFAVGSSVKPLRSLRVEHVYRMAAPDAKPPKDMEARETICFELF